MTLHDMTCSSPHIIIRGGGPWYSKVRLLHPKEECFRTQPQKVCPCRRLSRGGTRALISLAFTEHSGHLFPLQPILLQRHVCFVVSDERRLGHPHQIGRCYTRLYIRRTRFPSTSPSYSQKKCSSTISCNQPCCPSRSSRMY